jgi:hypothetical protein|tara:strand:+ start:1110 stop:1493 length:384 start_codon:yes stop_codon:yes gene_type:complete
MINNKYNIKSKSPTEIFDRAYDDGIYFTMGPISIHQFNEFSRHGINGLRILQYIRTKQGLNLDRNEKRPTTWVHVENKNLYDWFGVHQSTKWELLKAMAEDGLIEYVKRGIGKSPKVRIVCPEKKLN